MSELAQGLLTRALELPMEDRRWLGEQLLESEEVDEFPDAPHHDTEFMAELIRRSDEVHAHPERLLNLQDVLVELRQRLKERKAQ